MNAKLRIENKGFYMEVSGDGKSVIVELYRRNRKEGDTEWTKENLVGFVCQKRLELQRLIAFLEYELNQIELNMEGDEADKPHSGGMYPEDVTNKMLEQLLKPVSGAKIG